MPRFQIRACKKCKLRYPKLEEHTTSESCPRCGGVTTMVVGSFERYKAPQQAIQAGSPRVEALLDNVRSTWNAGSIFRTADGAGIHHLYLCGITPTPENKKVEKTALGSEEMVGWTYHPNAFATVVNLREQNKQIWALEGGDRSNLLPKIPPIDPFQTVVLVVGNELSGIDPDILKLCDRVFAIPMFGTKRSLNVAVAFGIAVYTLRFRS